MHMLCAEDEVRELREQQAQGVRTATYGRNILPIEALIAGLTSQPCRCQRHRNMQVQPVPSATVPAVPAPNRNPVWGDDEPLPLVDAAAYIGMPVGTLKQKIYAREISVVMVGKHP